MAGVRVSAAELAEKWGRRLKGATQDIRAGIEKVTVSPTEQAAAAQTKMRDRLLASIESGKWAARLRTVSLADWKKKALDVGVNRIAAGVDAAGGKMTAFASQLIAHENTVLSEIERLPNVTLEDGINRMTTFVRRMAEFTRT